ncbi:hypothetical protein EJ06DRAFT_324106 [Trichodelitschia bisporula]|uniref:Uncharacterized protein n=1 Tax=Trichodelitschia bisporula TaxID=703511 RepID=A0A6G1I4P1_9PEZI|nr:hypothetical protein EJ06DRAFT_324106 [Trichodelitschia bisporula]
MEPKPDVSAFAGKRIILRDEESWVKWKQQLNDYVLTVSGEHLINMDLQLPNDFKDPWSKEKRIGSDPFAEKLEAGTIAADLWKIMDEARRQRNQVAVSIRNFIISTVSGLLKDAIAKCETPTDQFHRLQARVAPSEASIKEDIEREYALHRKSYGSPNMFVWCQKWLILEEQGQGYQCFFTRVAILDFLEAIKADQYSYYIAKKGYLQKVKPDINLEELVKDFQDHMIEMNSQEPTVHNLKETPEKAPVKLPVNTGQSDMALKNKEKKAEDEDKVQKCLCGLVHLYWKCWVIDPDLAPPGWKPTEEVLQKVQHKLAANPKRLNYIKRVLGKQPCTRADKRGLTKDSSEISNIKALVPAKPGSHNGNPRSQLDTVSMISFDSS